MAPLWFLARIWAFFMLLGTRVRKRKLPHPLRGPAIVVANHASFFDWSLIASVLRTNRLHFVMSRDFFTNSFISFFLRKAGCIATSVFTSDNASAIAMMRAIRQGGILVLFPEARIGASARTEFIAPSTARFLRRVRVPLYGVHIDGMSLVSSKWGGRRGGGTVEVSAKKLKSSSEIAAMSEEEVDSLLHRFIFYDDYLWLSEHPSLHYRKKRRAEGLENMLFFCPSCGARGSIVASGDDVSCSLCHFHEVVDDRFSRVRSWQDAALSRLRARMKEPSWKESGTFTLDERDGQRETTERGTCTLDKTGLAFAGEKRSLFFPREELVAFPFVAGGKIVIFRGSRIYRFLPEEGFNAALFSLASILLRASPQTPPEGC